MVGEVNLGASFFCLVAPFLEPFLKQRIRIFVGHLSSLCGFGSVCHVSSSFDAVIPITVLNSTKFKGNN
jgi:hypothetical protein